jgi:hypothetical protein
LPKENNVVVELNSEQAAIPTLWTCLSREIIPGRQYSDGKRVLQDYLLRCQAKDCTHKVTLSSLGSSCVTLYRHLRKSHDIELTEYPVVILRELKMLNKGEMLPI